MEAVKRKMDPNLINPLMMESGLPVKEMPPSQTFKQLQTMSILIKKLSFDSWDNDNFHIWTPILMYAKIVTKPKFEVVVN